MHMFYPQTVVFILGAAFCIIAAVLGLRRRDKVGSWSFVGMMLSSAVWTGSAAVESAVLGQRLKVLWSQAEYCGLVFISVFLLLFALSYTRQNHLLRRSLRMLLCLIPVVSLALVWTNGWHHLLWTGFSPGPEKENVLVYHRGPLFWLIIAYTYCFAAFSYGVFAQAYRSSGATIRRQYTVFLLSGLFPLTSGLIYIFGQDWVHGMDVAPMGFSIAGLMIAWSFFRFQLLDLVPIGREVLVERMPDGMIVFDQEGRLVDMNPSARRLLGIEQDPADSKALLDCYPALKELFSAKEEQPCALAILNGAIEVNINMTPLYEKHGRLRGRLFVLHDITEQVKTARERERIIAELSQALVQIKTLQGLLPICCSCKKIRNDDGYWQQLESYIQEHAGVTFSHGLCPECERKLYNETKTEDGNALALGRCPESPPPRL